jgi:hypothetical protein
MGHWFWLRFDQVYGQEYNAMEPVVFDTLNKNVFIKIGSCEVQEIGHVIPTAEPLPTTSCVSERHFLFPRVIKTGVTGFPGLRTNCGCEVWVSLGHITIMSAPMWFQDAARFVALNSANGMPTDNASMVRYFSMTQTDDILTYLAPR